VYSGPGVRGIVWNKGTARFVVENVSNPPSQAAERSVEAVSFHGDYPAMWQISSTLPVSVTT
jgi:hypothetical protein